MLKDLRNGTYEECEEMERRHAFRQIEKNLQPEVCRTEQSIWRRKG